MIENNGKFDELFIEMAQEIITCYGSYSVQYDIIEDTFSTVSSFSNKEDSRYQEFLNVSTEDMYKFFGKSVLSVSNHLKENALKFRIDWYKENNEGLRKETFTKIVKEESAKIEKVEEEKKRQMEYYDSKISQHKNIMDWAIKELSDLALLKSKVVE